MTNGGSIGQQGMSVEVGSPQSARFEHPTGKIPRNIAIVACGPTQQQWHAGNFQYERQWGKPDEVWALNKGLRTLRCDLGFVMDDMLGEGRKCPSYADDLRELDMPVITSTVDEGVAAMYPGLDLHEYPVNQVLWNVGARILMARGRNTQEISTGRDAVLSAGLGAGRYLHNSIPYILAYALFIGVKEIGLFGADYTFPGQDIREDDRANAEYWVGMLRGFGVNVMVPPSTTLLATNRGEHWYGFGARPPPLQMPWVADIERECEAIEAWKERVRSCPA